MNYMINNSWNQVMEGILDFGFIFSGVFMLKGIEMEAENPKLLWKGFIETKKEKEDEVIRLSKKMAKKMAIFGCF